MTTLVHKRRYNVMETARPGVEGSVGDCIVTPQLAVSTPGMPVRFDKNFYDRPSNGSLITAQPYVLDSNWNMGRGENTSYGIIQQDLRAPDKLHEPTLQSIPQYMWRNKIATVYEAKRTGFKFLPLPGPYQPAQGEMVRGGQVVRTTDIEGLYKVVENQQDSTGAGLARRSDSLFKRNQQMNKESRERRMNNSLTSPMVTGVPSPSLNSQSANFRVMDPHNMTTVPRMTGSTSATSTTSRSAFG